MHTNTSGNSGNDKRGVPVRAYVFVRNLAALVVTPWHELSTPVLSRQRNRKVESRTDQKVPSEKSVPPNASHRIAQLLLWERIFGKVIAHHKKGCAACTNASGAKAHISQQSHKPAFITHVEIRHDAELNHATTYHIDPTIRNIVSK